MVINVSAGYTTSASGFYEEKLIHKGCRASAL
jgi:hypothetical protein